MDQQFSAVRQVKCIMSNMGVKTKIQLADLLWLTQEPPFKDYLSLILEHNTIIEMGLKHP